MDNRNEAAKQKTRTALPDIRGERGIVGIVIFALLAVVIIAYVSYTRLHEQKVETERDFMEDKHLGMKCEKAVLKVVETLQEDMAARGAYPYHLDEEFLERHPKVHRFIYNAEYWAPETGSLLRIETAFGDSYELFGYCRDNNLYTYVSTDKQMYSDPYSVSNIPERYRTD